MTKVKIKEITVINEDPNRSQEDAISMISKALMQYEESRRRIVHDEKTWEQMNQEWNDYADSVIATKGEAVGWDEERRKEVLSRIFDKIRELVLAQKIRFAIDWGKEDFDQGYEIINLVVGREH